MNDVKTYAPCSRESLRLPDYTNGVKIYTPEEIEAIRHQITPIEKIKREQKPLIWEETPANKYNTPRRENVDTL